MRLIRPAACPLLEGPDNRPVRDRHQAVACGSLSCFWATRFWAFCHAVDLPAEPLPALSRFSFTSRRRDTAPKARPSRSPCAPAAAQNRCAQAVINQGRAMIIWALRRFEFVPVWGCMVVLLYCMRRVDCRACGVRVEAVPSEVGKHQLSRPTCCSWRTGRGSCPGRRQHCRFAAPGTRSASRSSMSCSGGSSTGNWDRSWRSASMKIQYGDGHKYLTLVYQIEQRVHPPAMDRPRADHGELLDRFFTMIGEGLAKQIQFVCSDMWKPYLNVIAERCSQAIHILDRFPYCRQDERGIEPCACRRGTPAGPGRLRTYLEKVPLVCAEAQAQPNRTSTLPPARPAALQPADRKAYLLKEDFQQLWEYESPTWAGKFLDEWCRSGSCALASNR